MDKSISIGKAVEMYLEYANSYYAGSRESKNVSWGLNRFFENHMGMLFEDLNAPTVAEIRDSFARSGELKRPGINKLLGYVTRFVRWSAEYGHAPASIVSEITVVRRLQRGRHGSLETQAIRPAPADAVQAVLPHLPPQMQSWVELLQLTGMRPGEARLMRLRDLEPIMANNKQAFRYTLEAHKTAYKGKRRRVFLVGRAYQLTVERISSLARTTLFEPDGNGYLFSPDDDGEKPYSECALSQRVRAKCAKLKVEHWSPNQLRHGFATESRSKGVQLDLIADLLGHADPRTTLIYAEPDDSAALGAAIKLAV